MPYPDDFRAEHLFPTSGQLSAEVHGRKAVRLSTALDRAASAMDALEFRVAGLCSPLDDLSEDDVQDAARVAEVLEMAFRALRIGGAGPC